MGQRGHIPDPDGAGLADRRVDNVRLGLSRRGRRVDSNGLAGAAVAVAHGRGSRGTTVILLVSCMGNVERNRSGGKNNLHCRSNGSHDCSGG